MGSLVITALYDCLLLSMPVKEFGKLVNIWQSYEHE